MGNVVYVMYYIFETIFVPNDFIAMNKAYALCVWRIFVRLKFPNTNDGLLVFGFDAHSSIS